MFSMAVGRIEVCFLEIYPTSSCAIYNTGALETELISGSGYKNIRQAHEIADESRDDIVEVVNTQVSFS